MPLRWPRNTGGTRLALAACLLIVVSILAAECGARLLGARPFTVVPVNIHVEPGGRMFQRHAGLGYRCLPGSFKVTLPTGHAFHATHGPDTLRRARRDSEAGPSPNAPELWLFGCSFTYGFSVDDEDTLPWRVQEQLPRMNVVNFGVPGYGTIHSVLQLNDALQSGRRPRAAIVLYGDFHDERNAFLRRRRKSLAAYNHLGDFGQPYAFIARDGSLGRSVASSNYPGLWLIRYSAFANLVDEVRNERQARTTDTAGVSRLLLLEFSRRCQEQGVTAAVVGIARAPQTARMLTRCEAHGIPTADISYDPRDKGNLNAPADPHHPSPRGQAWMAARLVEFVQAAGLSAE